MSDDKTKLGRIKCGFCGEDTLYLHLNERTQTIGYACAECDTSGFAKKGTRAHTMLRQAVGHAPNPEHSPAPAPSPEKPPAPAPKAHKAPQPFSLEFP